MGWCSGTEIFDSMVEALDKVSNDEDVKFILLVTLTVALEQQDWDCHSDSNYYDYPVVQKVFKSLHPHWFDTE